MFAGSVRAIVVLSSMKPTAIRGVTDGAGDPETLVNQVWRLMTPAERLAIWEDARLAWTHDAEDVIAHIQRGRDEADRELPPRLPSPVYMLAPNIIIDNLNGEASMLAFLREQTAQSVCRNTSIITEPQT
jgi:hypothetical protein